MSGRHVLHSSLADPEETGFVIVRASRQHSCPIEIPESTRDPKAGNSLRLASPLTSWSRRPILKSSFYLPRFVCPLVNKIDRLFDGFEFLCGFDSNRFASVFF